MQRNPVAESATALNAVPMSASYEETARLLAEAYRLGKVTGWTRAGRGWAGEIFRLETARGVYAAKEFASHRPDPGALERRVAFADACRAAGVPNPRTLRADGAVVVEHPETGRSWVVQDFAEGTPPERTDLPAAMWLARQAATIGRLAVPVDAGERVHPFYAEVTADWTRAAGDADAAGCAWAGRLGQRIAEFTELAALVNGTPFGDVVTCHRDLKAHNTLLAADGSRALLDWDTSGAQEPWRELGLLLIHHVGDDAATAAIAGAYRDAGGGAWPAGPELFATGLAVWLNFLHGQIGVVLDAGSAADRRARAGESAQQLVGRIPSMGALAHAAAVFAGL